MGELEVNGFSIKKIDDDLVVNSISLADSEDVASVDLRIETQETARSTDVDSLDTRVSLEESAEASAETSLNTRVAAQETARSEDYASIDTRLNLEETSTKVSVDIPVTGNTSHINIDYQSMGFSDGDTMVVHGSLRDAEDSASNPIIATQISGTASYTGVTFIFSDDIPENTESTIHDDNSDYVMDVIVQKKMND